jgi:hypothetical protein
MKVNGKQRPTMTIKKVQTIEDELEGFLDLGRIAVKDNVLVYLKMIESDWR